MAVAYDNSAQASGSFGGSFTPTTVSYLMGSGNGMLLVAINTNSNANPVASITYNGVAMTLVSFVSRSTSGLVSLAVYALAGPASGTNSLVVTWNGNISYHLYNVIVQSYTGALQATPSNASAATGTGVGSANQLMPITTAYNNSWAAVFLADSFGSGAYTFVTGTKRQQLSGYASGDSNAAITPASSYSFSLVSSNTELWQWCAVEIPPAVAASLAVPSLSVRQAVNRSNTY